MEHEVRNEPRRALRRVLCATLYVLCAPYYLKIENNFLLW